ncbi:TPA: acetoin dehydrogenase [Candidatus Poribacteria bacterium]|nr:acetoin dehydrogenase [Candidatus Poribacteria bacterium]
MILMQKVRSAILYELDHPLKIIELNLPAPEPGEVLVKVLASGICHTQLLEIKGENATGPHNPNFLGHEGSGIVVSVGEKVTKVKEGDHVILSWIRGDGTGTHPKPIEHNGQQINRGSVTTFSDYTVASENRVTPIRKDMPLMPAALVGCAVATGMGMVFNNAQVEEESSIMIIGCGGIGINAIHAASIAKASTIIAVDRLEAKLEVAKRFGATHTVNSSKADLKKELEKLTNQQGLDYAIETVGKKETMEFVYNSVKKTSGKAILCGVPNPPGQTIEVDPFPLYYGRQLIGTSGGETNPDIDFDDYCSMYIDGILKLDDMISHILSLDDINEGIELMKEGKCIRVLIDMQKE